MNIDRYFGTTSRRVIELLQDVFFRPSKATSAPTPSVDTRGIIYRTEGGAGVSDTMVAVYKDAADAYVTKDLVASVGGGSPTDATYIVQTPNATLTNEQALSALATGLVKNTTSTGVLSIAVGADLPSHGHAQSDVTSLVSDLAAKAPVGAKYIVQTADATLTNEQALSALATGIVKNTTTTGVLSIAVGADLPSHGHAQSDVTNLVSDLAGKAASVHTHAQSDVTNLVSDLAGKAASVHTHAQSDVTNLVSDLAGKAATSHGHAQSDVTNLVTDLGNKQPLDTDLTAIAGLTSAANKVPYATGAGTWALGDFSVAGRALVDDADATAQRATLGLGTIATQASSAVSITGGSVTGVTDIAVADGGTGASTAANARTNLGVVIGTDVQAYAAVLGNISTGANNFLSDYLRIGQDHTSSDFTNTSTATNVDAVSVAMTLPTGTWTVHAHGGGTFYHSAAGQTTRVNLVLDGTVGTSSDLGSTGASTAQMTVVATSSKASVASGARTFKVTFRSTVAGTITCTNSFLTILAIRTA